MKSSAETKSGFKLPSIDEHRLSVGLLALIVLTAAGYGIWLAIASFLPQSVAGKGKESRREIADSHFRSRDWSKSVELYREMLTDCLLYTSPSPRDRG